MRKALLVAERTDLAAWDRFVDRLDGIEHDWHAGGATEIRDSADVTSS